MQINTRHQRQRPGRHRTQRQPIEAPPPTAPKPPSAPPVRVFTDSQLFSTLHNKDYISIVSVYIQYNSTYSHASLPLCTAYFNIYSPVSLIECLCSGFECLNRSIANSHALYVLICCFIVSLLVILVFYVPHSHFTVSLDS